MLTGQRGCPGLPEERLAAAARGRTRPHGSGWPLTKTATVLLLLTLGKKHNFSEKRFAKKGPRTSRKEKRGGAGKERLIPRSTLLTVTERLNTRV